MTTPVKCTECDGRGWKIVTRRGCVVAMGLHMELSAREDCLYCGGLEQLVEMFEWEVFVTSAGTDATGAVLLVREAALPGDLHELQDVCPVT
jgi:hypothetical protein